MLRCDVSILSTREGQYWLAPVIVCRAGLQLLRPLGGGVRRVRAAEEFTMLPIPQDRMSGRRSSSIVSRTLLGRRASVYVTTYHDPVKLIMEINGQVALLRDMLIHIGQPRDCPELRERVRRLRRACVEACKHTTQLLLPALRKEMNTESKSVSQPANAQIQSLSAETVTAAITPSPTSGEATAPRPDSAQLVLLFFMAQLLLRELAKCHRLVQLVPMDMSGYFENRAGPSNLGNVISQILLCKQITPDFNQEELCSIAKDSQEITRILNDMQEYLPKQDHNLEKNAALTGEEVTGPWRAKSRRGSLYKSVLCCVSRPNYL